MFFLKSVQLLFIVLSVFLKIEAADVQTQVIVPASLNTKLNGLDHKIDSYKNVVVTLKTPSNGVVSQLKRVIAEMQKSYKNYGLYVQIPVNHGDFSTKLEKIGFKFCESDTTLKTLTYLYANGRNIPELNYAYTAAAVYLLRNNPETGEKEILIINEQQKTIANIVGGCSDKGESPEDTVVREAREEVGITLNKMKLKLLAVAHTIRDDKKSCVEFLYVCDEFQGTPKVDNNEVSEFSWVPVSELLKDGIKVFGKPFRPFWQKLLKGEFKDCENGAAINNNKKAYQHFSSVDYF